MSFNEFEEYKKQEEPEKKEKAENWSIAIGLQAVDGLKPSTYLIEIAKENIEGKIDAEEVQKKLSKYYETDKGKDLTEETKEADIVSSRINSLLANSAFTFTPTTFFIIHDYLFSPVYPEIAGNIRKVNLTKKEEVLNGDTVQYGTDIMIKNNLDAVFEKEYNFDYSSLSLIQKVRHIEEFTSQIWQIHPFREGNTRAVAVFIIKYLRTLGFKADNTLFDFHSKYFRDALVRANYQNLKTNVYKTFEYLDKFFDNLLLNGKNELNSKDLKINVGIKQGNVGINVGINEVVLKMLLDNPKQTATEIATLLGKSSRTIERAINTLKEKDKITRIGSNKTGHWEVIIREGDDENL